MDQFEVTSSTDPPEVTPFWADATDQTAWSVQIPWVGEIWGYDRKQIAAWLRAAAEQVEQAPEHSAESSPPQQWDGKWHAECACGQVFSREDRCRPSRPAPRTSRTRGVESVPDLGSQKSWTCPKGCGTVLEATTQRELDDLASGHLEFLCPKLLEGK